MNHNNTMVAPTLWGLLLKYFEDTYYYEQDTLNKFYLKADTAHQHAILDMFAYAQVRSPMNAINVTEQHWGDMYTDDNNTVPKNLSLTMDAIYRLSHLNVTEQQKEHFDTPEHVEQLAREVNEQNHWRNNHPYFCDVGLLRDGEQLQKKVANTIDFSVSTANLVNEQIAATLLAPASMAGVVLWCRTNPIDWDAVFPVEVLPAVTACQHQYEMMGSATAWGFGVAVAHCSPNLVCTLIIEGQHGLIADDYVALTEMLETLFPVREHVYRQVTRGFSFASRRYWVIRRALGELFDIFGEVNTKPVPLATRLWVLENYTPAEGLVMKLNHEIVF